ncbi:unnamed protein product [Meganyctiphanes norvegica]|uniref:Alpha/beta hydrolase n=1 Tax=Meganyctiphanes norvegica TaxID=48144 RepID=A0AAV2RP26_MEGNR
MGYFKAVLLLFCCLLNLGHGRSVTIDPYWPGDHDLARFDIHYETTPGLPEGLEWNLDVWAPIAPGSYPVMYYLSGDAMGIAGEAYEQVMRHIASYGYVVILPSKTTYLLTPEKKTPEFVKIMSWCEDNLGDFLYQNQLPMDVHLDYQTLIGGAHSAGAHTLVQYLKDNGCGRFQALALMSPVDGVDPFVDWYYNEWVITEGERLNFDIPTLHIAAGLDPAPGGPQHLGGACAPTNQSNDWFWNAFNENSVRWSLNATDFGHVGLCDKAAWEGNTVIGWCAYNHEATDEQFDAYRRFVAGQTVSFIKAVFEDDCRPFINEIEDTSRYIVNATMRRNQEPKTCPHPVCRWRPAIHD